jgi:uncharacterized protein (TIGR02594 family)
MKNQKKKNKIILIILLVVGLLLAGLGLFFLIRGRKPNEETGDLGTDGYENLRKEVIKSIGTKELKGEESNTVIEQYFKELGYTEKDDTPWCGAYANYMLKQNGFEYADKAKGLSALRARDLEKVKGKDIDLKDALPYSTVVVAWRESKGSGLGHVGFYVREEDDFVVLCGGNQSDEVNDTYKLDKKRITRVFNPVKMA